MAYDPGLAQRVREALSDRTGVTERKMFGGLAFMLHGHMFVGVQDDTLMARVGPARYAEALAMPHVRQMDFTGRPLTGYVYVGAEALQSDSQLAHWVDGCAGFVARLPPKKPKP